MTIALYIVSLAAVLLLMLIAVIWERRQAEREHRECLEDREKYWRMYVAVARDIGWERAARIVEEAANA